jgi:hypothetical protein
LDLDREQQFRDTLDLVDDHPAWVIDESNGIRDRCLANQGQVQITPFC